MPHLSSSQLHRWLIPFVCGATFLIVITCVVPYCTSQWWEVRSLSGLILALSGSTAGGSIDKGYCLFVPFIFAFLVYNVWKDLKKSPIEGSNFGLVWIVLGLFSYWFGMRASDQYFGYAGVQLLLAGVILFLWGTAVFRLLLFPWAFFMFAWPLPFLDPIIAFPLRMIMSTMAAHILPFIGIPTIQSGTALISPGDSLHNVPMGSQFQIDIADPCSGIRSLFALLMFSALFGYLFLPKLWQQWVIFLSAFPLAILGNLARVIILVLGSVFFGSAFAVGTNNEPSAFHEGAGFLVYAIALGAEFGLASLLTRKWNHPDDFPDADQVPA
jgi:exosortase